MSRNSKRALFHLHVLLLSLNPNSSLYKFFKSNHGNQNLFIPKCSSWKALQTHTKISSLMKLCWKFWHLEEISKICRFANQSCSLSLKEVKSLNLKSFLSIPMHQFSHPSRISRFGMLECDYGGVCGVEMWISNVLISLELYWLVDGSLKTI